MKKARIVFDNDETLTQLVHWYDLAEIQFFQLLFSQKYGLGPFLPCWRDIDKVIKKHTADLFKTWGVKRGRCAEGLRRTYATVCDWVKKTHGFDPRQVNPEIEEEIKKIGDLMFVHASDVPWKQNARQVLRLLRSQGHELFLLTCYDRQVFPSRYRSLGLDEFFGADMERVRVTEFGKTPDDFKAVSGWTPENDSGFIWVTVGNSKSDILPAVGLSKRWHGFCVGFATTSVYVGEAGGDLSDPFTPPPIDHPRVKNARNIAELPDFVDQLCKE